MGHTADPGSPESARSREIEAPCTAPGLVILDEAALPSPKAQTHAAAAISAESGRGEKIGLRGILKCRNAKGMIAGSDGFDECETTDIPCSAVGPLALFFPGVQKTRTGPPPAPKVTVAQPVKRTITEYLELTGNTQALYTVQLVARVAGYLEKVFFRDGQIVRKGEPLFLIQRNTYEAGLQQAEAQILLQQAQLEYAGAQLIRYTHLLSEKAASQSDVDNWRYQRDSARANLRAAEAQRDLARLNLDYTLVSAPFDGRIDRRLQDPGNLVGAGANTVLAQFNRIDPIYVYFNISDKDLARLMKVTGSIPGQAARGKSTDGRSRSV